MTMRNEDLGRLLDAIEDVEVAGQVELFEAARALANGEPEPDPFEDDGQAGMILGRAEW